MKLQGNTDILVIGSTFAAFGISYFYKKDNTAHVTMVEKTATVGTDFTQSLKGVGNLEIPQLSEDGKELYTELKNRNILSADGRLHMPATAPVLNNRIVRDGADVLFMTDIVKVEAGENGYEVEYYNSSGFQRMHAKILVDTTGERASRPGKDVEILSKSINAILFNSEREDAFPETTIEGALFQKGRLKGETIMRFPVDPRDHWPAVRKKLYRFWLERPEELYPWTIAAVADAFDLELEKGPVELDSNWYWLPSCAYGNLFEAFEAGIRFGKSLTEVRI